MQKRVILALASILMTLAIAGSFQNPTSVHGVSHALTSAGDLLWYRHDGRSDGSARWSGGNTFNVGTGWGFKQVFSGDDGVIYGVRENGELLWYRHDGRADGSARWSGGNT